MLNVITKITQGSDVVKITTSENGQSNTKNVSLESFIDFMKTFSSVNKDTGYIPASLIREVTNSEGTKRIYYFKELVTDIRLQRYVSNSSISVKADNPSDFTYNGGQDILTLKNMHLRDVGAVICNNASEGFTAFKYAVGFIKPPMTGIMNDRTEFSYAIFNNHFHDYRICWPRDLNISPILNSKDPFVQSTVINQYFSSIFNTDIHCQLRAESSTITSILDAGFVDWFNLHFTVESSRTVVSLVKDALGEHNYQDSYLMKYLIIYFVFKTNCVRLEALTRGGRNCVVKTLGDF